MVPLFGWCMESVHHEEMPKSLRRVHGKNDFGGSRGPERDDGEDGLAVCAN